MEPYTLDDIMQKADELGLLIQDTDVYRSYREMAKAMESDKKAAGLLAEYEARLREIETRRIAGDIIEQFEMESLKDLTSEVRDNVLIMDFLAAKEAYAALLEKIQQSLVGESPD